MPSLSGEEAQKLLEEDVSLPGKVFLKQESERQPITLPTGYSTTIEDEYSALESLHSSAPGLAAEPYTLTDEPEGYLLEYVEGERLEPEKLGKPEKAASDLSRLGRTIIESKTPHGDLRPGNIYVNEGSVKVVDPAGIVEGLEASGPGEMYQRAVNWDVTDLNNLISRTAAAHGFDPEPYLIDPPKLEF